MFITQGSIELVMLPPILVKARKPKPSSFFMANSGKTKRTRKQQNFKRVEEVGERVKIEKKN